MNSRWSYKLPAGGLRNRIHLLVKWKPQELARDGILEKEESAS